VSKYSHGEFVSRGGFVVTGQRKWFRNTPLGLAVGVKDGKAVVFPAGHRSLPKKRVFLAPGGVERTGAAESIKSKLGIKVEEALSLLPPGNCELKGE